MTLQNKSIRGQRVLSYYDLTRQVHYDPKTGIFTWKINKHKIKKGSNAVFFAPSRGYCFVRIEKKDYPAHRLAWFYMTKLWPEKAISFRNKNPQDIKFLNLIPCDKYDLQACRKSSQYLTGVNFRKESNKKPWYARIYILSRSVSLGYYATEKEAHRVYLKAKKDIQSGIINFAEKVPSEWRNLLSPRRTLCEPARGEKKTYPRNP